jgi:hypothetical protein
MKNKKLVELGILTDDENSGVSAISLVENPAIEVDFLYFKSEKFVKPTGGEDEGKFIGRCMSAIEGEFPDQEQRLAVCYSYWSEKMAITPNPCWKGYEPIGLKTKNGRQVPNCVKMEDYDFEELNIFGYNTRFFFICPGAEATFEHLISMNPDDETIGMIRSAAVVADRVFEIEKEVIDNASATQEQMKEAIVLVDDFYDIMYEIDEELGMVHNVQYMDGHLEVIADYLPEELSIDTAGLPPYVDEIGKKKDLDKFESYTDYPESAKSAAKRALEWRDSHPDQDCGTAVGWTRANQLAKGEPISEETIARIASFARHLQYKDVPYSEGCGGLMVDAWGGPAAIEWASNKLDRIRDEKLSKFSSFIPSPDYTEEELESIGVLAKKLGIRDTFSLTERFAEDTDEKEIRYRYEGDSPQRQFCRTFIGSLYTRDEINQLSFQGVNKSFGHNGQNYSLFKYKGGPYCKHFWQKYEVNLTSGSMRRLEPVNDIERTAATRPDDMTGRGKYPGTFSALRFADEEQKIVVGPAMIPNMEIPRKDEDGDIYYVKFSEETIKEIMMKFMKEARTNATNQDHQEDLAAGAYVYESWLVEDPENDKANTKYGFNVPKGTWMVSMKIDDKETWKRVKSGELRGFSVEGMFSNLEEIQTVKQYIKIMKILKD